jgi:hypothetical protein
MRARVCACGCKEELLKEDGTPDFSARRFFNATCRNKDKAARLRAHREKHQKKARGKALGEAHAAEKTTMPAVFVTVRGVRMGARFASTLRELEALSASSEQGCLRSPASSKSGTRSRSVSITKVPVRSAGSSRGCVASRRKRARR